MAVMVKRAVLTMTVIAASLSLPAKVAAGACAQHELSVGRTAGSRQPAGSPDTDWLVTATPLLGAPFAAVVTERHPLWSPNPYVDWITVPGGSAAPPLPDLTGAWPAGVFTYQLRFTVAPGS